MKKTSNQIMRGAIVAFTTLLLVFMLMPSVFAGSTLLMSYDGTGIRSKDSVQNFQLTSSTNITLKHKTTAVSDIGIMDPKKCELIISLLKKGTLFYSATGNTLTVYGVSQSSVTWIKGSGKYKLHFETMRLVPDMWPSGNIFGTVSSN